MHLLGLLVFLVLPGFAGTLELATHYELLNITVGQTDKNGKFVLAEELTPSSKKNENRKRHFESTLSGLTGICATNFKYAREALERVDKAERDNKVLFRIVFDMKEPNCPVTLSAFEPNKKTLVQRQVSGIAKVIKGEEMEAIFLGLLKELPAKAKQDVEEAAKKPSYESELERLGLGEKKPNPRATK